MRIAVIGGGLQGCAVALELSHRGLPVDLYERAPQLLQGASRHSEGKIHLGYVYAADETMRTPHLMASGAAAFLPTLNRWLGASSDTLRFSAPFHYGIHRASMLTPEELGARYQSISRIVCDAFREHPSVDASEIASLRPLDAAELSHYTDRIDGGFATAEIAVDTDTLADAVEHAVLERSSIRVLCRTSVDQVDVQRKRLSVVEEDGSIHDSRAYDHIVNCSWDGLPRLDATAGIFSPRTWSYRVKYFVRIPAADHVVALASATFVLGQFGDVVDFGPNGAYLSWYPTGRTAFTTGLRAPEWSATLDSAEAAPILDGVVDGLSTVMPAVGALSSRATRQAAVRGGLILAHGDTDLDDEATELHQRHSIGPSSSAGYHSVNTGKMTMAPVFAVQVAERIRPKR